MHSRVFKWPKPAEVEEALKVWAAQEAPRHAGLLHLGWFGSYARGDAGMGSDLNLIAVIEASSEPFLRRALAWNLLPLPVPAEILIYTRAEWEKLQEQGGRFIRTLEREARWLPLLS